MAQHDLTLKEIAILEEIAASTVDSMAQQAAIILSWYDGLSPAETARALGVGERAVRDCLIDFSGKGMGIFPKEVRQRVAQTVPADEVDGSALDQVVDVMTVAQMCRRYHVDVDHATHVAELAQELLDFTQPLHQIDAEYRTAAYHGGLLHNVAYAGGARRHHTRGRDILLRTALSDLEDEVRAVIAVSTVFHRKRWKEGRLQREPAYTALPPALQEVARWISALVRIADGLDYSHSQATTLGPARVDANGAHFTADGPFVDIDVPRADDKADMWRAVIDIPITIATLEEAADGH